MAPHQLGTDCARGATRGLLGTMAWLAVVLNGCLYLEDIGKPIQENRPPYFFAYKPEETTVEIGPSEGTTFSVYYTDPDEEDVDRLEMQWYLDGREQGNGNKITIWMEDLGNEGTGVLVANVTDPQGAQDSLLWKLVVASPLPDGE